MAIFNRKKKEVKEDAVKPEKNTLHVSGGHAQVLVRPRITEKAGIQSETDRVYTFEVTKNATKGAIVKAVEELYKVAPIKVNIVNLPAKTKFVRGKWGRTTGVKKAFVYLKKGDKIEFI
jgi:large subunit ribosomal protein L23